MSPFFKILLLTLIVGSGAVQAVERVRIDWGQAQRFELQRRVDAGEQLEVCGPLAAGQAVDWQFVSSQAVAFAIHHRIGKQPIYVERRQRTRSLTSRFQAAEAADYCWSWRAPKDQAAQLQLLLRY